MISDRLRWAVATSFVLVPLSATSLAQDARGGWETTPRVSAGLVYSDNISLAPKGEEDSELVTRLDAGIALAKQGAQTRVRMDYNLIGLLYRDDSDANDVFHQFEGDARVDMIGERLYLDALATYGQRNQSRGDRTGDIVNTNVDRTDVFNLRLSPVYVQPIDDFATAEVRYIYDRIDYEESDVRDTNSQSNRVQASLDSGPMFTRLEWNLSFDREETDFDDGSSVTFQTAEVLGRLNVTDRFSVFGALGDERNSFDQDPSRSRPDDTYWRAGATFTPTPRTFTEVFVGERFFGTTYGGTLRRQTRDGRLFADYSEELRTVRGRDLQPFLDEFGQPVFDSETGRPIFELPELLSGAYLRKRFSAGMTFQRGRTNLGLRVYDERREFVLTDRDERLQGVIGDIDWRAAPRTSIFARLRYEESTFADELDREDTLMSGTLGVRRDLGQRTSVSAQYQYLERESTDTNREYGENRVALTFNASF